MTRGSIKTSGLELLADIRAVISESPVLNYGVPVLGIFKYHRDARESRECAIANLPDPSLYRSKSDPLLKFVELIQMHNTIIVAATIKPGIDYVINSLF